MPISDRHDRGDSQADTGLLEYIDRRRLYQVRERRHRFLVSMTVALGVLAAILAVSNVILLQRLNATPDAPPPASVASAPPAAAPAAPAPAAQALEPEAPAPVAPAPAVATAPAASARSEPALPAPRPAIPEVPATVETDSAQRTARWLVQTHGRLEAENRAAKVAEFYSGEQGAFWKRVLLNVRQEPEP